MRKNRFISISALLVCSLTTVTACKQSVQETPEIPENQVYLNSPYDSERTFENATDVNGGVLMLASSGSSEYKIVKAADASIYDDVAVQDLQDFLFEASGCKLPIVTDAEVQYSETDYYISVGTTALYQQLSAQENIVADHDELNEDGAIVHVQGNAIYLTGAAGYGTLNAVYRFLEYEVGYEAYALDEIYVEKMVNVPVLKFNNEKFLNKSVYRHLQFGRLYATSAAIPAARMGLISSNGSGVTIEGKLQCTHVHSFKTMLPAADCPVGWWNNGQLCLTNDDVVEAIAEVTKEYMLKYPTAKYIMYGGNDEHTACNCMNCQTEAAKYGGHGALMLQFCNKVSIVMDEWLKENGREDFVFWGLNYLAYETAPAYLDQATGEYKPIDENCVARDNVGTYLCFPGADYGHSLDDPTSPVNVSEYRKLKAWSAVTDHIGVYLYMGNYIDFFQYYNAISAYQGWMRAMNECNVELIFTHIDENKWQTFSDLKLYVLSKLSADASSAAQEELTIDFMKHYYKAAATEMYEFYNQIRMHQTLISANNGNNQNVDCYDSLPNYGSPNWFPLKVLNNFMETLNRAYERVNESVLDEEVKEKVRFRILAEEFNIRYYRYQFHSDTMTVQEKEVERIWLNAGAKTLEHDFYAEFKRWTDV